MTPIYDPGTLQGGVSASGSWTPTQFTPFDWNLLPDNPPKDMNTGSDGTCSGGGSGGGGGSVPRGDQIWNGGLAKANSRRWRGALCNVLVNGALISAGAISKSLGNVAGIQSGLSKNPKFFSAWQAPPADSD